jgi:HEAT repeat protein
MRNMTLRAGLCLVVGTVLGAIIVARAAGEEATQDATALLMQAINHYEKGIQQNDPKEIDQAAALFEQVLALQPTSQDALTMRRKADLKALVMMKDNEKVGGAATKILDMMSQAARTQKREVTNVDDLWLGVQSPDLPTYLKARAMLLGHGPYAVPYLLRFITRQGASNQMAAARTISILTDIGRDATAPLLAALRTNDEVLKSRIVAALGQIGDVRAVPPLLAIAQNPQTPPSLALAARDALKRITGKSADSLGSAVGQYRSLAKDYLTENTKTVGFVFGEWQEVWKWNPEPENLADRLSYELVPSYLYYPRQGAEIAREALQMNSGDGALKSLLVCLLCRELQLAAQAANVNLDAQVQQNVAARAAYLNSVAPVAAHLNDADVVGGALRRSTWCTSSVQRPVWNTPGAAKHWLLPCRPPTRMCATARRWR